MDCPLTTSTTHINITFGGMAIVVAIVAYHLGKIKAKCEATDEVHNFIKKEKSRKKKES